MEGSNGKKFYVTTPIYYVNDLPHIGHAYTTVAADALARFKRLKGFDVLFLTGTDEHGQKVEKAAQASDKSPKEFADSVVPRFIDLWKRLGVSNDDFVRTTEGRHIKAATHLWETVKGKGDIYLGEYEDWYCTPCETFWTESQMKAGKCPDCGRSVEKLKEPSYFFRLSSYGDRLLRHIDQNPDFIQPEARKNEVTGFVREGLRDLSISRTTFSWGVPVPGDPAHIMYVWFDALANYLTATGYPSPESGKRWPADVHLIGKDILRFHAVYWPAFLMSAGLPLPGKIFAHGWWTVEGEKMSKSRGNVVDPVKVSEEYGVDPFRYFLLREVRFGLDGDFSMEALKTRINSDLANDLGNLLSRTLSMILKYRDGEVPPPEPSKDRPELEGKLKKMLDELPGNFENHMERINFYDALSSLWAVVRELNAYVDKAAPFREKDSDRLSNVLYNLADGLRAVSAYINPFMPASSGKIRDSLGLAENLPRGSFGPETGPGKLAPGSRVRKIPPLFPRIE